MQAFLFVPRVPSEGYAQKVICWVLPLRPLAQRTGRAGLVLRTACLNGRGAGDSEHLEAYLTTASGGRVPSCGQS